MPSALTERYLSIKQSIPANITLVVVSKFQPIESIQALYDAGHRIFGENRVQELMEKQPKLPTDIQWHCIGTLQTNKVKYIAPFVSLIHSVDSQKLLLEIDKQAKKNNRVIDCLLEMFVAQEETKHGLSFEEAETIFSSTALSNVRIKGFMGMATNTDNKEQVQNEFQTLAGFYKKHEAQYNLEYLSMGMSGDYKIAIEEGSNMIRVGSIIFSEKLKV
ncbi:MAG TPA: YggS family pyridoxal phosphate-dependent enzyme [Bacteroidia bacterium]|nr:YggS family pyridoxal phosphate-dependent enzyme [Bacteroidia bacterium]